MRKMISTTAYKGGQHTTHIKAMTQHIQQKKLSTLPFCRSPSFFVTNQAIRSLNWRLRIRQARVARQRGALFLQKRTNPLLVQNFECGRPGAKVFGCLPNHVIGCLYASGSFRGWTIEPHIRSDPGNLWSFRCMRTRGHVPFEEPGIQQAIPDGHGVGRCLPNWRCLISTGVHPILC